ncbi:uncharacterized protein KZ484_016722 [Pholidichthys leucotaenia]
MRAVLLWMLLVCFNVAKDAGCSDEMVITTQRFRKVIIPCPPFKPNSKNLKYELLFNGTYITTVHLEKNDKSDMNLKMEVIASNSGVYSCKNEKIYPPPFREDRRSTMVIVEDASLSVMNETGATEKSCPDTSPSIPEVVMLPICGALLLYSLVITCITIALVWKKKRKNGDTIIYANTKPCEFRKPQKV